MASRGSLITPGNLRARLTSYVGLQSDDEQLTNSVLFWMLGSLGGAEWHVLPLQAAPHLCRLLTGGEHRLLRRRSPRRRSAQPVIGSSARYGGAGSYCR